jgi:hypothetical protein
VASGVGLLCPPPHHPPHRGVGLLSQAESGARLAWFAATAAVFSVVSLVPLLKGESPDERAGPMNADAELWNGRLAMLGIVALAATEYHTGAPFVDVALAGRDI